MTDPYGVLGLKPTSNDEEVKKAYRDLVRKYHPDNYHNNPLADLAQEKMKEINEAYDQITKQRSGGGKSSQAGSGWSASSASSGGSGVYTEIRNAINAGNVARAEQLLNSVSNRDAEWHFLMGGTYYRKGWFDDASREFQTAVNMDPTNAEYREALGYIRSGGSPYRAQGNSPLSGMSNCDCCSSLLCADCCCECMGGDLIPCC